MRKQSKNLSLDPAAIRRGERYSELHGTNVSQLVNRFLSALPIDADDEERRLSPAVRRLMGIAASGAGTEAYHRYLEEKYSA
jgi:hypothetical protein